MNYMQIDKASISNGLGFRVVLWCAGCERKCKNCFNPETWDFNAGQLFDENAKKFLFEQLQNPYIKGVTFSGGHPLESKNCGDVLNLILDIKTKFPNKDIWLYTGYELTIDDFTNGASAKKSILCLCDVVVDGPYITEEHDITLAFRGSRNQRVIDVKETLQQNKIITLQID